MKIDGYSVSMSSQYYTLKSSAEVPLQEIQTDDQNGASGSKSDSSIKSADVQNITITQRDGEKFILRGLSASLLASIKQTAQIGENLGFNAVAIEAEALTFEAKATIKTQTQSIDLTLNVSLLRSFVEQTRMPKPKNFDSIATLLDPIILNLEGTFPSLGSNTFSFDIDSDGTEDQISTLQEGSAFLALDKNSSGRIDNGSELFGTKSGNGFEELRQYDEDKNSWIDANDPIFSKLRIWQKTETTSNLLVLGEVGIGAIFLGDIDTPFSLKDNSNSLLGVMRQSSFFLFEDGKAGMISQIDMATSKMGDTQKEIALTVDSLKKLQGISSYQNQKEGVSSDARLEKLQETLKTLEAKLQKANEEEKTSIEVQINSVNAQIMTLLTQ